MVLLLCISVLRVASGPRVKLVSCKSALNPPVVCSTDRSKAVVPVLVLLFVALWFILRGDLLYVFPCVILFLCFSVLLVLRLPRLGKRELILVLFVRFFGLCLFRFVGFLFLLGSGKGCVCDCGTPWTFLLPFLIDQLGPWITNRFMLPRRIFSRQCPFEVLCGLVSLTIGRCNTGSAGQRCRNGSCINVAPMLLCPLCGWNTILAAKDSRVLAIHYTI